MNSIKNNNENDKKNQDQKLKTNYSDINQFNQLNINSTENNINKTDTTQELETDYGEIENFDQLNLKENLLRGIYSYGFEKPSAIQKKGILPMIKGRDVIAQSQSGTGKTATFVIGTLQLLNESVNTCQAIIVAHTRELASQIMLVASSLAYYMKNVKISLCIGGTSTMEKNLDSQIIICTPGRIIKLIETNIINTNNIKLLVVDEADELLSDSFIPQLKSIIKAIPLTSQICLFSATMQQKLDITKKFMRNPIYILVNQEMLTLEGISQFYIALTDEIWKFDTLVDLYEMISISQSIIYVNGKKKAEWLKKKLEDKEFMVSMIHGDMEPVDRTQIMDAFRKGSIRILIATDLIGRGIDVQQVSIVVNYDIPRNKENYIHRIGRSGRFGRKGVAINFATKREEILLQDIRNFYHTQIEPLPENIEEFI